MKYKIRKDVRPHLSLGKGRFKQDTCTHLLEWQRKKIWQSQVSARIWRNWNLYTLLVRKKNGASTLEDSPAVSQKAEQSYHVIYRSRSTRIWNECPHKNAHVNAHSSFIHNDGRLEDITPSFCNERINELWYIRTAGHHGGIKARELSNCAKTRIRFYGKEASLKRLYII